jgi:hypothetical protein
VQGGSRDPAELPTIAGPLPKSPVEQHVLLQQWGFELTVRVSGLGSKVRQYSEKGDSTLQQQRAACTNPLCASEEASTPSTSDTGGVLLSTL